MREREREREPHRRAAGGALLQAEDERVFFSAPRRRKRFFFFNIISPLSLDGDGQSGRGGVGVVEREAKNLSFKEKGFLFFPPFADLLQV